MLDMCQYEYYLNCLPMSPQWYALRVRSNFEHTTSAFVKSNGHQVFLPTYREQRQWSDRIRDVDVPLFRGYFFCNMDIGQRQDVVRAPGFLNIVKSGPTFVPVPESEIAAVMTIVNSPVFKTPWPYVCLGEKVIIYRGPLAGVEGILLEQKSDRRVIVSVHLLQRSVAAEVSLDWVRPVKESFQIRFEAAQRAAPVTL
jgi:transcription antitermination factor NusG